jgi:hypothetical protein
MLDFVGLLEIWHFWFCEALFCDVGQNMPTAFFIIYVTLWDKMIHWIEK